jgi:DNA polymerase
MRTVLLQSETDVDEWRSRARELLLAEVPPESTTWLVGEASSLFANDRAEPASPVRRAPTVPREFLRLADSLLCHSDPQRFALLYRILWRLTHGEANLLQRLTDNDMVRAIADMKSVRRDSHKMKAFVRFREVKIEANESIFIAWFEPEHYIVERVAPFFVRRFAGMKWSILTPYRSAHWNGDELSFAEGAAKADAPSGDALEDLWRTYYSSIFNPARLKLKAMKSEMPVKYWKNLPEAAVISTLIREARSRMDDMINAAPTTPRKRVAGPMTIAEPAPVGTLAGLRTQARECRACALWKPATQTVFGEGPEDAEVVFIGEQPGDQEDLGGKPFIGPAGKLFDRALAETGIDRTQVYVTNTVKHFKFEPRGKFRPHKRASTEEQKACWPWLAAELEQIKPKKIVCLGSMAASAMFGSRFKLLQERGQWRALEDGTRAFATVHPSYLLRLPDAAVRESAYREFVRDLELLHGAPITGDNA